ncbi:Amidase [Pirellula staleyi DSM 6068]|uniref:Amidase n=1 Tax=Pirellula staleyi (strain ATCC 27377 / DSM 6068 / ICPB 4128) TaxID=530564 RepID=D2R1Y2_PIRSD|nr:Amidase [Pirellula staleyi DSM 6068]
MVRRMTTKLPTIEEAARMLRAQELTAVELTEQCLANIDQFDERVKAWTIVDRERALSAARALDSEAARFEFRSPLHGIPIGIKDIIDVEGLATGAGFPLRKSHVALQDAPVVKQLRAAGCVMLGKTVTTQFACFDPAATRNPWDLQRSPGGSSSGSAAAVASEMCLAAIGTQTGGSILRPASFCGVAGYKPGFGCVDMRGVVPVSYHLDHVGPLARTVSDLYEVWKAIAMRVPPVSIDFLQVEYLNRQFDDWVDSGPMTMVLRVAEGPILAGVASDVQQTTESAIRKLQSSMRMAPLTLPPIIDEVPAMHRRIMAVEAAAVHRENYARFPEYFLPTISALIEEGLATSAVDYAAALAHQRATRQQMMQVLVTSGDEPISCFVLPSTVTTATEPTSTGSALLNLPWSYVGLPAITIPCGTSAAGLPCGLQFVGPIAGQVFALAGMAERVLACRSRPKMLEENL